MGRNFIPKNGRGVWRPWGAFWGEITKRSAVVERVMGIWGR